MGTFDFQASHAVFNAANEKKKKKKKKIAEGKEKEKATNLKNGRLVAY